MSPRAEMTALLVMLAMIAALCLGLWGCGTTRDTQTKTVERIESVTGPLVVDTPIGQFVAQPVRHSVARSEDTVEKEDKRIDMPEIGSLVTAAAGSTPWGGIIGSIVAAGAGFFAVKARKDASVASRQRDELIDGVEAAKGRLAPDAWGELTEHLERNQSRDTVAAVKARVG